MRAMSFLRAACLLFAAASASATNFQDIEALLEQRLTDVQAVVVLQRGRVVYEFYRDGAPDKLRDGQSVEKSALAVLTGIALQQGKLRGLDVPVVDLVPEWKSLNGDPRAAQVTVRHLLTMTSGFEPTLQRVAPRQAWQRRLVAQPGEKFAYDNAVMPVLGAVLEKSVGMPLADYARRELLAPLGLAEPNYGRTLEWRTVDMARIGQLLLDAGRWGGTQLLPADYVREATTARNGGGAPVGMPYGYLWWVAPAAAPEPSFMASGWGGQMVWVLPAAGVVVAVHSTASPGSQQRGHAAQLLRSGIVQAAQQGAR